jgi:hypothetical protein
MNRIVFSTLSAAVAIAAATPNVGAQSSYNPWQIGGAAGIAFPTGDLDNVANVGFNVTLAGGYQPRNNPLGVRAEAAFNQFGNQGPGRDFEIPAFTGNLIYAFQGVSYSPYVIGGVGLYRPNIGPGGDAESDFGFNVGGGIKLPFSRSFETFVEARYHHVSVNNGSLGFIPITIGIMW